MYLRHHSMRPSPSYFFVQWLSARFFMARAYSLSVCSSSQCSRQILSKSPTFEGKKRSKRAVESTLKYFKLTAYSTIVMFYSKLSQISASTNGGGSLSKIPPVTAHVARTNPFSDIYSLEHGPKQQRGWSHDRKRKTSDYSEKQQQQNAAVRRHDQILNAKPTRSYFTY